MADKKKDLILAIMAGKGKPAKDKEESDKDYCLDCAKEMLSAIEAKSASRLAEALRTFMDAYEQGPHEEYSEEEDSED